MAVTFGWKGVVDTDLQFSEFYRGDHTIIVHFLLQYPLSYTGPILSVNGTGQYIIGQGNANFQPNAHLFSRIENAGGIYVPTPTITFEAGVWYQLAVVRASNEINLFINGELIGTPLALTNQNIPVGTLRLGRPAVGTSVDGQEAQFYGMIDELAVYTHALTSTEILAQYTGHGHLNGHEQGLLAGWIFSLYTPIGQPAQLARPITRSGQTEVVATSANWDGGDMQLIPLPDQTMDLPFLVGEAWGCTQGYAATYTHRGYAAFCWDFQKADSANRWTDIYPNGTHHAPIYSTGYGEVTLVSQSSPPTNLNEPETENRILVRRSDGFICTYLHLLKSSVLVSVGQNIIPGQQIAQVSTEWRDVNRPGPHLHFALEPDPHTEVGSVTVPCCFSNYEIRNAQGQWSLVSRGIPKVGQIIRRKRQSFVIQVIMLLVNLIRSFIDRFFRPVPPS